MKEKEKHAKREARMLVQQKEIDSECTIIREKACTMDGAKAKQA
jgi:hypothetical protein